MRVKLQGSRIKIIVSYSQKEMVCELHKWNLRNCFELIKKLF